MKDSDRDGWSDSVGGYDSGEVSSSKASRRIRRRTKTKVHADNFAHK
jgi:hypothetical protein